MVVIVETTSGEKVTLSYRREERKKGVIPTVSSKEFLTLKIGKKSYEFEKDEISSAVMAF